MQYSRNLPTVVVVLEGLHLACAVPLYFCWSSWSLLEQRRCSASHLWWKRPPFQGPHSHLVSRDTRKAGASTTGESPAGDSLAS